MMMAKIEGILTDIIVAMVQPFLFAGSLSVLFMFLYMYAYNPSDSGQGIKKSFLILFNKVRNELQYRKMLLLAFVVSEILFTTLLNRDVWLNPFSHILGNLWLFEVDESTGNIKLVVECLENIIMMVPFSMIVLWIKDQDKIYSKKTVILESTRYAFCFSCTIEVIQMVFRIGSIQVSDLLYNSIGGLLGGTLYLLVRFISQRNKVK